MDSIAKASQIHVTMSVEQRTEANRKKKIISMHAVQLEAGLYSRALSLSLALSLHCLLMARTTVRCLLLFFIIILHGCLQHQCLRIVMMTTVSKQRDAQFLFIRCEYKTNMIMTTYRVQLYIKWYSDSIENRLYRMTIFIWPFFSASSLL